MGKKLLALCALSLLVAACKAKVSAKDEGGADPAPKPFNHVVAGPVIDGTWKSGCERDFWDNGYVIFEMLVRGQDVRRVETKYSDARCAQSTGNVVRDGYFRYLKNHGTDIFEVEYKFKMTNGFYFTGDNIRRIGNVLYISDRRVGPGSTPLIALNMVP